MKKILSYLLVSALSLSLLIGCGDTKENTSDTNTTKENNSTTDTATDNSTAAQISQTDADIFTDRDYRTSYDEESCVHIQLNGTSATSDSNSVNISGTTITISEEAVYVISGTLDDGMIIIDADDSDKIQLVLDNASITSSTSAALYVFEADKVFVTLVDGTTNTLANGGSFTAIDETNIDAAVFSKQDLTFNGSGSLSVTSPAGHGIVCKDDLVFTGGTYTITSASHGLDANDSIRITDDVEITADAGKDGLHCENNDDTSLGFIYISNGTLTIEAEGDGISAGSYLTIAGGNFSITAGGGSENGTKESSDSWGGFRGGQRSQDSRSNTSSTETKESSTSMKGIKAKGDFVITDGTFSINSADDSIHSNASITINGGTFEMASGDDGVHADDTLTITTGTIHISESYEGLEALHVVIEGGTIQLVADDDGINAAGGTDASGTTGGRDGMFGGPGGGMSSSSDGTILISGGAISIQASGDGIDANGTLEITGGYTTVTGPTQGDTATLDYDLSGTITGGTFIGTGASGMAQSFSDSEQGVIALNVGNQSAGTLITLTDADGNVIIEHTPELSFQVVILSTPELISGETYSITVGTSSGEFEAQ